MPYIPLAVAPPHECGTESDHGYTQQLAHGQPAERQIADMRVRLADEFDDETENAVADSEQSAHGHGRTRLARIEPENAEQRYPFQGELIQLRRVACQLRWIGGKHHGPGHVGSLAPELGIDEVADTPRAQPDGHQRCDEVHQTEEAGVV